MKNSIFENCSKTISSIKVKAPVIDTFRNVAIENVFYMNYITY